MHDGDLNELGRVAAQLQLINSNDGPRANADWINKS